MRIEGLHYAFLWRLDQLAAALADAVGQQDSATREIASSIAGATQAARDVTDRITEVSNDAREAGARANSTQAETARLAANAALLTRQVVSILRTAVPEGNGASTNVIRSRPGPRSASVRCATRCRSTTSAWAA